MDNKKLFKFLYKDIAEIEELFDEKGAGSFDELEMEFIRTRFSGAKSIIQLLSERDEKSNSDSHITESIAASAATVDEIKKERLVEPRSEFTTDEKESLKDLAEFEEEVKENDNSQPDLKETELKVESVSSEQTENKKEIIETSSSEVKIDEVEEYKEEPVEIKAVEEVQNEVESTERLSGINGDHEDKMREDDNSFDTSSEIDPAHNRIGDRMVKEKSVNDLLLGKDNLKLEYKISNSPVGSIQTAIGINDRYQYIRELFDGSADNFIKTVSDLDKLNDIKEAVSYLQENFKWKKNETSLKFVNLVKRRFPNG